jgi:hypothetical protein
VRLLPLTAVAVWGLLAAPALADPPTTLFPHATTFLLSRSHSGGMPNGPSRAAAISGDDRRNRVAAFESDASNIVPRDSNGLTDVFVVHRRGPYGNNGARWKVGDNELASRGLGGRPANGRSYAPAVDGSVRSAPGCVAFVSDASNLVRGDTNGVADAFLYSLRSHRIRRVSVSSGGAQANGATYDVAVSGDCGRVAFTSTATNLALTHTRKAAWKGGLSAPVPPGHRQVYVRFLGRHRLDRGFRGMTAVASVSNARQPGNGDSFDPAFASSGKALAFTSTSTNLTGGDPSPSNDVYVRQLNRKFVHLGHGRGAQTLLAGTRLVSATPGGVAGNGPSQHPAVSGSGRYVAYDTAASDLLPGDGNGVPDVVRADLDSSPAAQRAISRTQTAAGNGASSDPSITDAGHFLAFESDATNLKMYPYFAADTDGVRDVLLGIVGLDSSSPESLDSSNRFLHTPSSSPAISARGNYILFESADPRVDASTFSPGRNEVYMRFLLGTVD